MKRTGGFKGDWLSVTLVSILALLALLLAGCSAVSSRIVPPTPTSESLDSVHGILQDDGLCSYQIPRPRTWKPTESQCCTFTLPDSQDENDQITLQVLNYRFQQQAHTGSSVAQYQAFVQNPTLKSWTKAIEKIWENNGITFELLDTLPEAKIYLISGPDGGEAQLAAYTIQNDDPLGISLTGSGAFTDGSKLKEDGVLDDFAAMLNNIKVIGCNATPMPPEKPKY